MTIQVPLTIERIETIGRDVVQVWGHVGDYEVCLYLPKTDPRVAPLLTKPRTRKQNKP